MPGYPACGQLLLFGLLLLASCAGPQRWADQLSVELRCGMSVAEVGRASQRDVQPFSSAWRPVYREQNKDLVEERNAPGLGETAADSAKIDFTHWIGGGSQRTSVLLAFKMDKLVALRIEWLEAGQLMGVPLSGETRILCEESVSEVDKGREWGRESKNTP